METSNVEIRYHPVRCDYCEMTFSIRYKTEQRCLVPLDTPYCPMCGKLVDEDGIVVSYETVMKKLHDELDVPPELDFMQSVAFLKKRNEAGVLAELFQLDVEEPTFDRVVGLIGDKLQEYHMERHNLWREIIDAKRRLQALGIEHGPSLDVMMDQLEEKLEQLQGIVEFLEQRVAYINRLTD